MSCLIDTAIQAEEATHMMTRLYPGHELPQFPELASEEWKQTTLELKMNCTYNNQDYDGQTTDDQSEADYQS